MSGRPIYIFDLDGTLALINHRLGFIQGDYKDWRAFFAACPLDGPNWPVIHTLQRLRRGGAEIWVWSGRSDEVRAETEEWLYRYGVFKNVPLLSWEPFRAPETLLMRKAGDHRPDHHLKAEWLADVEPPEYKRITGVFEDRARVVRMWRELDIPCFQVADGEF
ncbi:MAG: hypothetical protein AB7Q37_18470 [Pyrinomonadaceae bacterium]